MIVPSFRLAPTSTRYPVAVTRPCSASARSASLNRFSNNSSKAGRVSLPRKPVSIETWFRFSGPRRYGFSYRVSLFQLKLVGPSHTTGAPERLPRKPVSIETPVRIDDWALRGRLPRKPVSIETLYLKPSGNRCLSYAFAVDRQLCKNCGRLTAMFQ